jgi:hypothetical protein
MDIDAQHGDGADDVGVGDMVVFGGQPDVTRLHGQSLDWLLNIRPEAFTAIAPVGHTFQALVSLSSACSRHHAALQERYRADDALPKDFFSTDSYNKLSRKDQSSSRKLSTKVAVSSS